MLALPGSLLWLFLLVYFSCGQILDKTSLDTSSNEGLDKLDKAVNHTVRSNEEEKENKTAELAAENESNKSSLLDDGQVNLLVNKTSKTTSQYLSESVQNVNGTTSSVSPGKNNRRRVPNRTTVGSNTTEVLMMSEERRNSYLSIAERRKYYNRTRVQAKKSQAYNVDAENQETASNLGVSSTETPQVDDVGTVKKPVAKDSSKKVTIDKNQASNQRLVVNFASNEMQVKPQSVRQSVIQSQYQFGQKLNSRKPVSRARNMQEEKSKRKKEKGRAESAPENSTNRLIKNYPTQSTKLIRVDKNLWPTTTVPRADADDDNFVAHSLANRTAVEKLNDYSTSNDTRIKACCNETEAALDRLNIEAETTNQTTVPEDSHFNPLPLNNLNVALEQIPVKNISANEEKNSRVIQDVYNQEILKLNKSASITATGKGSLVENSVKNVSNYDLITPDINNSELRSEADVASDIAGISTTAAASKTLLNPASKENLTSRNGKFSNAEVMRSSVLKSSPKEEAHGSHNNVTATVKVTPHELLNLTSGLKYTQSEKNVSKHAAQVETKVKSLNGSLTPAGAENWNKMEKTDEYPLTIELNENNKRVLSEMFQTLAIPNQKKMAGAGETLTSQTELLDISKNGSSTNNVSVKSPVETTTQASKSQSLPTVTPKTTSNETIISAVAIDANVTTAPTTEDPQVLPPDMNEEEDYNAQGTRYNTKFYISPKLNGTQVIKVVEEDDDNDDDVDVQSRSAGIAIYVLAASGLIPLLVALVFGAKFMMHRNQREYECESDAKSDISANESQMKDGKKKKGSTNLKKSPSNVTTITLVTTTRLPRVQHWENSDKQGNRNWEFPRSKLKLKTILGQGNFGQVWKAEAEDMPGHEGVTRLVAVKTVKEGATEKEHTEFIKELEIMQQIGSHPNIVALLGCCTDQEPFYLIMEYVKFGKLLTYLREHRINENYYNFSNNSDALTSRDLTVFAYCVARGMEYLASRGIIHRDLAARNVLVDHNKICKIADFGMSRSVRDFENGQVYEERQQKGALPIRWMAPESLVYSVFTYKSDVWSFGIVMWEIVTLGSTPYPNMGAREVMRKVRDGYRLERPSHCKLEFYRLISYCWAHDPNKRPDFSELRHELGNLLDNPTKDGSYVDLDRFAVDNSFHIPNKNNDFGLLERNDFQTLRNLGDWVNKDWAEDKKKIRMKKGKNNGKGTVTLTGQGSFTVNSRILEKEFKII